MAADLPELVHAVKVLSASPTWVDRGPDAIGFTAPLQIGEVVIEGLTLRGRCRKSLAGTYRGFAGKYATDGFRESLARFRAGSPGKY